MAKHYDAFISYRHCPVDSRVAAEIQHQLEHCHIPKAIREKTGIKKIERVFRDKEELPITVDINVDISEAIENSDYLILICSPRTQQSTWVMREIGLFLTTHPKSRILTVLAEGDPAETIPEILRYNEITDPETGETVRMPVEPLSSDFRMPFKKARQTELPRLLAAMLGVSYDEVRQRQHQYEARRRRVIFSIAAAVAAVFMGYFAYSNAQIRRANDRLADTNRRLENMNSLLEDTNVQLDSSLKTAQTNLEQSLINQSIFLASSSDDALSKDRRTLAIQLALAALPDENNDRPYVIEAEQALINACGVYDLSTTVEPVEEFELDGYVEFMEFTEDGSLLLVADSSGKVNCFDIGTGLTKWTAAPGVDDVNSFLLIDDRLVLYTGYAGAVCYEIGSGDEVWRNDNLCYGAMLSSDGKKLVLTGYVSAYSAEELLIEILDPDSGTTVSTISMDSLFEEKPYSISYYAVPGAVSASGRYMLLRMEDEKEYSVYQPVLLDLEELTVVRLPIDCEAIKTAAFDGDDRLYLLTRPVEGGDLDLTGRLFGGSYEVTRESRHTLSAWALDTETLLWEQDLNCHLVINKAQIHLTEDSETLFVSFSNQCYRIAGDTGETLCHGETDSPIIFSYVWERNDGDYLVSFTRTGKRAVFVPEEETVNHYARFKEDLAGLSMQSAMLYAAEIENEKRVYIYGYESSIDRLTCFTEDTVDNLYLGNAVVSGDHLALDSYDTRIFYIEQKEGGRTCVFDTAEICGADRVRVLGFSSDASFLYAECRLPDAPYGQDALLLRIDLHDGTCETIEDTKIGYDSNCRYFGDDMFYSVSLEYADSKTQYRLYYLDLRTGEKLDRVLDMSGLFGSMGITEDDSLFTGSPYAVAGRKLVLRVHGKGEVLYDMDSCTFTALTEISQQSDLYPFNGWLDPEGTLLVIPDEDALLLYDGFENEAVRLPVEGKLVKSVTVSPEKDMILVQESDGNIYRYDMSGELLGTINGIWYYTNQAFARWEWTDSEVRMWSDNTCLCVIDRESMSVRFGMKDCIAVTENKDGREQFVRYYKTSDQYRIGSIPRYTLAEEIAIAREILCGREMGEAEIDYYGLRK